MAWTLEIDSSSIGIGGSSTTSLVALRHTYSEGMALTIRETLESAIATKGTYSKTDEVKLMESGNVKFWGQIVSQTVSVSAGTPYLEYFCKDEKWALSNVQIVNDSSGTGHISIRPSKLSTVLENLWDSHSTDIAAQTRFTGTFATDVDVTALPSDDYIDRTEISGNLLEAIDGLVSGLTGFSWVYKPAEGGGQGKIVLVDVYGAGATSVDINTASVCGYYTLNESIENRWTAVKMYYEKSGGFIRNEVRLIPAWDQTDDIEGKWKQLFQGVDTGDEDLDEKMARVFRRWQPETQGAIGENEVDTNLPMEIGIKELNLGVPVIAYAELAEGVDIPSFENDTGVAGNEVPYIWAKHPIIPTYAAITGKSHVISKPTPVAENQVRWDKVATAVSHEVEIFFRYYKRIGSTGDYIRVPATEGTYEGTANTLHGIQREKIVQVDIEFLNKSEYAQLILDTLKDVVISGTVTYNQDYDTAPNALLFLDAKINVAATGETTGFESIAALLMEYEYNFETELITLTVSTDRSQFLGSAF